jgi:tyrosyl-tRNA synthetase
MTQNKMTLSEELTWRGLIYQTTFKNISEIDNKKFTVYHGFDASAPSQTIGNLASMMIDLCFLRHGHKTIVLAGGATSLVGDAGGRDSERLLQQEETIRHNVECAKKQIQKIYGKYDFTLVNNIDWFKDMNMLTFLRDIGKSFNVGDMIKKDIVADRIGEGKAGISYTEFSYSLLQGYDFLHLFDNYNCTIQLCGADQWTNCLSGVELIRKKRNTEAHVITNPLIVDKKTGKKFGKSVGGAIWLDAEKTPIFDFYQFWINCDDEGSKDYIKIYTEILPEEYENLVKKAEAEPSKRIVQKYLAYEVTKIVHNEAEAEKAKKQSEELFGNEVVNLENINAEQTISLESNFVIENKINLVDFLVEKNLLKSKREAREFIESGAVSINEEKVENGNFEIEKLSGKKEFLLRIGKKKYYKIEIL